MGPGAREDLMTEALDELRDWLGGDKVTTSPSVLQSHGRDENFPEVRPPLAVAYAEQIEDVQTVLRWCREQSIPRDPVWRGHQPGGGARACRCRGPRHQPRPFAHEQVLSIQPENFLAVVQPGVTRTALNTALRYTGLMFPVDPGADASLGGMAATNASGTTTVRYGGMRQNTLALQVVLANGEVLRLGRPVQKTSSGYDLKDLFIGSSGTLGVITELTVRLHPSGRARAHLAGLLPLDNRRGRSCLRCDGKRFARRPARTGR